MATIAVNAGAGDDAEVGALLTQAFRSFTAAVRVVLLRSDGTDFWPNSDDRPQAELGAALLRFGDAGIISVALVQGRAAGIGLQCALACDVRIASDDARFDSRSRGTPASGLSHRLAALVGYSRAIELCLLSVPISAQDALRIGLVNTVVRRGELESAGAMLAGRVLAQARDTVAETKALFREAARRTPTEQLQAELLAESRLQDGDRDPQDSD